MHGRAFVVGYMCGEERGVGDSSELNEYFHILTHAYVLQYEAAAIIAFILCSVYQSIFAEKLNKAVAWDNSMHWKLWLFYISLQANNFKNRKYITFICFQLQQHLSFVSSLNHHQSHPAIIVQLIALPESNCTRVMITAHIKPKTVKVPTEDVFMRCNMLS